jgi:hypothetical protein
MRRLTLIIMVAVIAIVVWTAHGTAQRYQTDYFERVAGRGPNP